MKHRTCSSSSRPRVLLRCQMIHTPVSSLIRGRPQTRAEHLVGGDHNNSHAAKKGCRYGRRLSIAGIALTQGLRLVASPPACATSGVDEVSAIRSVLLIRDTLERDDAVLSELTEILRVPLPAVASLAVELRNAQRRSPLEFLATGAFGLLDRQMDGASENNTPNRQVSIADLEYLESLEAITQQAIDACAADDATRCKTSIDTILDELPRSVLDRSV